MTRFAVPYPQTPLNLAPSITYPVDLLTGFSNTDSISIALAEFPLGNIVLNNSFVLFSSDPSGILFTGAENYAKVPFSANTASFASGDCELRFPRNAIVQLIGNINLGAITGVGFQIEATASSTFRCLGFRILNNSWQAANADVDTVTQRLEKPINRIGDHTATPALALNKTYWSDNPSSKADPTPIDGSYTFNFNTGSMTQTGSIASLVNPNEIVLALREKVSDSSTQLELGTLTQNSLNTYTQEALERGLDIAPIDDYLYASMRWGGTAGYALIKVGTAVQPDIYQFETGPLVVRTNYTLKVDLKDDIIRVRLYKSLITGKLLSLVYDTQEIKDPSLVRRRKGRVGFSANFYDGDAYIKHVRSSDQNFAEWVSKFYGSITPVQGMQLRTSSTGDRQLYTGLESGPWGGTFVPFPERSKFAWKVSNSGRSPLQGFQTNLFYLDSFTSTTIDFEIFVSQKDLDSGRLYAFLWDGISSLPLNLNGLKPNVWGRITIPLDSVASDREGGYFTFAIVQTTSGTPSYWIVNDITIKSRVIQWESRTEDTEWIAFRSTINGLKDGIVYQKPSKKVQARASARRQYAQIGQVRMTPKYAGLGKFLWPDEIPWPGTRGEIIPGIIKYTTNYPQVAFSAQVDPFFVPRVVSYVWTFGDGKEDVGPQATHTYSAHGTYIVTLSIIDDIGRQATSKQTITI